MNFHLEKGKLKEKYHKISSEVRVILIQYEITFEW